LVREQQQAQHMMAAELIMRCCQLNHAVCG